MPKHTPADPSAIIPRPGALRAVNLDTAPRPITGPTMSRIRFVGMGAVGEPPPSTLADLLELGPVTERSVAVYELGPDRESLALQEYNPG
jgi:hypothetical protein